MNRIDEEKRTVEIMIRLYCRRKEGNSQLCGDCSELLDYAMARLSRCPFGNGKPTCKMCTIHCYRPDMKERIRTVMRWSGPRMMIYHPVEAAKHIWREMRHSSKKSKQ